MTLEQREEDSVYKELWRVRLDVKKLYKGQHWNNTAEAMPQAKEDIKREQSEAQSSEPGSKFSKKERMSAVLARAESLAQAILDAFAAGNLTHALSDAGLRMMRVDELHQEYVAAYNVYVDGPQNDEKRLESDQRGEEYLKARGYQTLKEMGDKQPEYLKALDFLGAPVPNMRLYNVCRAKTAVSM